MSVTATTTNTGISAKKLKPIVDLVRGRSVDQAIETLQFLSSPAAAKVAKVVKSAAANAENNNMMVVDDLKVVEAYANDGPRLRRFRPQSRGRVNRIVRRFCHITVSVDEEVLGSGT